MFSVEVKINFDALQKEIKERVENATLSLLADMKDGELVISERKDADK